MAVAEAASDNMGSNFIHNSPLKFPKMPEELKVKKGGVRTLENYVKFRKFDSIISIEKRPSPTTDGHRLFYIIPKLHSRHQPLIVYCCA